METFPEDSFEMVKGRIVGCDETGSWGLWGGGVRVMETTE